MKKQYDYSKEWPKIKKQLLGYSKEAVKLAQKGEKEILRLSHLGKIHFDATALSLKQEQLYYLIGKEYVKNKCPGTKGAKLTKLINELKVAIRQQASLKRKIKKVKP